MNNTGIAHENGDVEQSHHQLKQAVDQTLRVRGSRDFASRAMYERFLAELIRRRNTTRASRWQEEQSQLRPLPTALLAPCRELVMMVSRFSTLQICGNTYSVPSRLIGTRVVVRVHSEVIDVYVGSQKTVIFPRLVGTGKRAISYRHVIWSLLRKPGAFAQYRYRDEFFPGMLFRQAYDQLTEALGDRADKEYLHVLYLAATRSEVEVATALSLLLESHQIPKAEAVTALVQPVSVPQLTPVIVNLCVYDALLSGQEVAYG